MRNKRIDAETDLNILADLSMGISHKVIANRYGVSPSYVSKLNTGRKVPDIHFISDTRAYKPVSNIDSNDYLEQYITECIAMHEEQVIIYTMILNKLKENKHE